MGLGMWKTSCPEAMGWGFRVIFEKKAVSWDPNLDESSWVYEMRRTWWGSDGTVSIVKIVSLSPRVEKPKSREGNKSFVPERDSYAYERSTYPYTSHICIIFVFGYVISIYTRYR